MPERVDNTRAGAVVPDDGGASFVLDDTTKQIEYIQNVIFKENAGGQFHPIYHIPISKFNGIEITGKFTTTDDSDDGHISYVTVGRQATQPSVGGGLGFAWRKSTLIPETYDSDGNLETEQLAYNCYIVDNSMLSEDIFIHGDNLITDGGVNNYIGGSNTLVYGRRTLDKDTTYKFKMRITTNYEITVWILDDGLDFDLVEDVAYGPDPNTGDPTNQYGYVLKKSSTDPVYTPNASGTHFGLSVLDTGNYRWFYSELSISSITDDYAVSMFKLDADPVYFVDGEPFAFYWRGWGEWDDAESDELGASVYIWDIVNEIWELVGSNTASITSPTIDQIITGSFDDIAQYRDGNNYVTALALATEANNTSEINTAYASIDNVTPSGIHSFGMIDIYVNDPDKISTGNASITVPINGSVEVSTSNGFILPLHSIVSITSDVTGNELEEGTDYTRVVSESKNAWSTENSLVLTFTTAPAALTVRYRYYADGPIVQDFIESEDYRNPAVDPLIKIKPPALITVKRMDYRGDISEPVLKEEIISWVNALETTLELSDFIAMTYTKGVDYINLDTLEMVRRTYNYEGTLLETDEEITTSYTLSGLQAFYTDSVELYGVSKIG